MNNATQFEGSASRSRGKLEGESSVNLCDRHSRTRAFSQRQLPTDHDYATSTREYQTDQSSLKPAPTAAGPAFEKRQQQQQQQQQQQKQQQKQTHRCTGIDGVTPYQVLLVTAKCGGGVGVIRLLLAPFLYPFSDVSKEHCAPEDGNLLQVGRPEIGQSHETGNCFEPSPFTQPERLSGCDVILLIRQESRDGGFPPISAKARGSLTVFNCRITRFASIPAIRRRWRRGRRRATPRGSRSLWEKPADERRRAPWLAECARCPWPSCFPCRR